MLGARLGIANPVAGVVDQLGTISVPVVTLLWVVVVVSVSGAACDSERPPSVPLKKTG